MYVYTRELDRRPGFDGVKIKFYYYIIIIISGRCPVHSIEHNFKESQTTGTVVDSVCLDNIAKKVFYEGDRVTITLT